MTGPLTLVFSRDSLLIGTISINDEVVYSLTTRDGGLGSRIAVKDLRKNEEIVVINKREIGSDRVQCATLGDKAVKVKDWMQFSKLEDGYECSLVSIGTTATGQKRQLVWKVNPTCRLALYLPQDIGHNPVTYMIPATASTQMALVIEESIQPWIDQVLASWMIHEQRLRLWETNMGNASGAAKLYSRVGLGAV